MAQRDYRSDAYRRKLIEELDPETGLPGRRMTANYQMEAPDFGADPNAAGGDPLAQYERRNEGAGGFGQGALKGGLTGATVGKFIGPIGAGLGAVGGALIGGIGGLFSKNAETAKTDFAVGDARDAISKAYQRELGRDASADEINSQLAGQGWDAAGGDRWVG